MPDQGAGGVQGVRCFQLAGGRELECAFPAADALRLTWDGPPERSSHAVLEEPPLEAPVACRKTRTGWRLETDRLAVEVSRGGRVDCLTPSGEWLRSFETPVRQEEAWTLRAHLRSEERLHGLGLRASKLNLRPGAYRQWNRDPGGSYGPGEDPLYLCIPVLLGRHAAGSTLFFFDNPFASDFRLSRRPPQAVIRFHRGPRRLYLLAGPVPALVERFTELTGRPPLPPRWALGFHQSRWGYRGQGEVRRVVSGFRERDLPLDAVHLDIDHLRGYRVFSIDRRRFPDLSGLAGELEEQGVRLVAIVDPGVKKDPRYSVYREGVRRGCFCSGTHGEIFSARVWPGWCAFPDFTRPEVRDWWGGQYRALLERGIAGFWHDMNEPAVFEPEQGNTFPAWVRHGFEGRGGDHREAHNLYGLAMARAGFEGLRRLRPERRPWILSRSGWAGLQRYAWCWTGDVESSWEALRMTLPSVLNLGLSGIPFSGPDIGGFSGSPSRELFLRWFQLAAFLPFFRSHAAWDTEPREPWRFGKRAVDIVRCFLDLRHRLLPYLYTLSWEATQTGHPLARPLFWDFPDDPAARDSQDTFLLGPALLIAPALQERSRRLDLALPRAEWFHFWDDKHLAGGHLVTLPAPLERIPVLVRGGSVLPLAGSRGLTLHLYPLHGEEARTCSRLYTDAGDGYEPGRLDRFTLERVRGRVRLVWESHGEHPWPSSGVGLALHGLQPESLHVDGVEAGAGLDGLRLPPFREAVFRVAE